MRKQQLGQFFTVSTRVQDVMAALVQHQTGTALEPSAGEGHLAAALFSQRPGLSITSVELDPKLAWHGPGTPECAEFLSWSRSRTGSFDVVFGNPPYVALKDVSATTRRRIGRQIDDWHGKANLYHLFIKRSAELLTDKGEMVFIVPTDWMYQTATAPLREYLLSLGSVTHVVNVGEERVFPDADVPALCIFRFQRGSRSRQVLYSCQLGQKWERRRLVAHGDRWFFLSSSVAAAVSGWAPLGEQFTPKVGMVTGLDAAFRIPPRSVEASVTRRMLTTTRGMETFIDVNHCTSEDEIPPRALAHLTNHKDALLSRRIRSFDESNWWQWGAVRNRAEMASRADRFFVLAKTRAADPFFTLKSNGFYTAGVVGLFRADDAMSVPAALHAANSSTFRHVLDGMQLVTGDKLQVQPSTLQDALFPLDENEALSLEAFTHPPA